MPISDFNILHTVAFYLIYDENVVSSTWSVQPSPYNLQCLCTHQEGVLWHNRYPNLQAQSSNVVHSLKLPMDHQSHPEKAVNVMSLLLRVMNDNLMVLYNTCKNYSYITWQLSFPPSSYPAHKKFSL